MTNVNILISALALVLFPSNDAEASDCSLSDWSSVTGAITEENPLASPRYSGTCALLASSLQSYVTDATPQAESSYKARFYFYTGNRNGTATIFEARTKSQFASIRIQHNGLRDTLTFSALGYSARGRVAEVKDHAWYAIELDWRAGTGDGELDIAVTGAGSDQPANVKPLKNLYNVGALIDEVRLGLISGSGSGTVSFDAYAASTTTKPGRLCRGDAVPDGVRDGADWGALSQEVYGGGPIPAWAVGQPDVDENGVVDFRDLVDLEKLFLSEPICP